MPKSSLRKNLKLKPSKLAEKRKKAFYWKVGLYIVFFLSLVVGISSLSNAKFMTIDKIEISGLEFLTTSQISEIVSEKTKGKILWLFPKTNIFLYPKEEIRDEIYKKYKRVYQAKISLDNFSVLDVSIEERKPFGLWCQTENNCYFLDEEGYIFDLSKEKGSLVKHFGTVPEPKIGKYFLGKENFLKLYNFIDLVSTNLNAKPVNIKSFAPTIEILFDTNTLIKVNIEDSFEDSFTNLITLISDQNFSSKEGLSLFESIDLRFGQKVFYKLK